MEEVQWYPCRRGTREGEVELGDRVNPKRREVHGEGLDLKEGEGGVDSR